MSRVLHAKGVDITGHTLILNDLQDVPEMKLRKHMVEEVKPGAARNHLVPNKLAIYAHYLNKAEWHDKIQEAKNRAQEKAHSEEAADKKTQEMKLVKRLKKLRLVWSAVLVV
jgi:ribosomal protein L9